MLDKVGEGAKNKERKVIKGKENKERERAYCKNGYLYLKNKRKIMTCWNKIS